MGLHSLIFKKRRLALGARKTNNRMDRDRSVRCNAGGHLGADGAKCGGDVVAERVHRACGGGSGHGRSGCRCHGRSSDGERNDQGHRFGCLECPVWSTCFHSRVGRHKRPSRRPRCVPVLLFCAACSVGDQVHKIFVPGRHFDVIDLGFDAAGYVTAMLLVLLAAALVRHATRPIGAHARR